VGVASRVAIYAPALSLSKVVRQEAGALLLQTPDW
jgi:hypothetical protein